MFSLAAIDKPAAKRERHNFQGLLLQNFGVSAFIVGHRQDGVGQPVAGSLDVISTVGEVMRDLCPARSNASPITATVGASNAAHSMSFRALMLPSTRPMNVAEI